MALMLANHRAVGSLRRDAAFRECLESFAKYRERDVSRVVYSAELLRGRSCTSRRSLRETLKLPLFLQLRLAA